MGRLFYFFCFSLNLYELCFKLFWNLSFCSMKSNNCNYPLFQKLHFSSTIFILIFVILCQSVKLFTDLLTSLISLLPPSFSLSIHSWHLLLLSIFPFSCWFFSGAVKSHGTANHIFSAMVYKIWSAPYLKLFCTNVDGSGKLLLNA